MMKLNRYTLAFAGILLGFLDMWLAFSYGLTFDINGRDASALVLTYLALSFGCLGFLLGFLLELRERERRSAELVREQLESLHQIRERLAQNEKLASLGQLASAIAHEMRNPLAIIRSTVQNLGEDLPGEAAEARENCGFVLEEIDRLSRVTSSLLDFSRPLHLEAVALSVEELFEKVALLSQHLLAPRRVRLKQQATARLPRLQADPDLACQVILGLLENAAKVTTEGGAVTLSAEEEEAGVALRVSDGGPGVPEDLRGKIFEPFFTTGEEGTGLGLAVARQIAEAHGGRLEVDDAPQGGAQFTLHLPAWQLREAA